MLVMVKDSAVSIVKVNEAALESSACRKRAKAVNVVGAVKMMARAGKEWIKPGCCSTA